MANLVMAGLAITKLADSASMIIRAVITAMPACSKPIGVAQLLESYCFAGGRVILPIACAAVTLTGY